MQLNTQSTTTVLLFYPVVLRIFISLNIIKIFLLKISACYIKYLMFMLQQSLLGLLLH